MLEQDEQGGSEAFHAAPEQELNSTDAGVEASEKTAEELGAELAQQADALLDRAMAVPAEFRVDKDGAGYSIDTLAPDRVNRRGEGERLRFADRVANRNHPGNTAQLVRYRAEMDGGGRGEPTGAYTSELVERNYRDEVKSRLQASIDATGGRSELRTNLTGDTSRPLEHMTGALAKLGQAVDAAEARRKLSQL